MIKILAYRFSAFGDVAMTVPVIREFLEQNPGVEIYMVSRENFRNLFDDIPNVKFIGIDFEQYKGFLGISKLGKRLLEEINPTFVADLHDVIRSKILNKFFKRKGHKVFKINKGKEEKEKLTDVWNLEKQQLKATTERYADVFRDMGFPLMLSHQYRRTPNNKSGIGIAPFAQHEGKMLPLEKTFEIAKTLSRHEKIFFFGGGKSEVETLKKWEQEIPNSECLAGKLDLKGELQKISELRLMISMDSANMHLASLTGTRCVSIWCSTHPYAGFLGYGQSEDDIIQVSDLTCRPCSVFGDKKCFRGDYACLHEINIQDIIDKALK